MIFSLVLAAHLAIPADYSAAADALRKAGLKELGAHRMLGELTSQVGARLSGSPGAAKAVEWTKAKMKELGMTNIQEVPCMVPHWVRGKRESASMITTRTRISLSLAALGGSVATPPKGVEAEVVEVQSLEEARALGDKGKGKIVFFNRPFDATLANTFAAYGGAVNQRSGGASAAAESGAVAVLVRSMSLAQDDEPHTGAMRYAPNIPQIPAAALGIQSADRLSEALKKGPVKVRMALHCQNLPDAPSASVCGDIVGSEHPEEILVVGGHLDSWDLGVGAHDDGAGVTQALEAARLMIHLGMKPKRTIRVVAWMNEENGGRGARAYLEFAKKGQGRHIAAFESDNGGFMPRGLGISKERVEWANQWLPVLAQFGVAHFNEGGGDADNGPLAEVGAVLVSMEPENQRYFDYHHSRNDTLDKVNPRELEMGALAFAALLWIMSEEGLG